MFSWMVMMLQLQLGLLSVGRKLWVRACLPCVHYPLFWGAIESEHERCLRWTILRSLRACHRKEARSRESAIDNRAGSGNWARVRDEESSLVGAMSFPISLFLKKLARVRSLLIHVNTFCPGSWSLRPRESLSF